MKKLLRYLARPGVYVALVGLCVFAGAACLWGGLNSQLSPAPLQDPATQAPNLRHSGGGKGEKPGLVRARLHMADLPYEEPFENQLEDAVKQADFALVQAMLRCDIPLDSAVVEKTELRQSAAGHYTFQRVRLAVGDDPLPFVTTLHEALKAWADTAEVAREDSSPDGRPGAFWTISVDGVLTHELFLSPRPAPQAGGETAAPGRALRRPERDAKPRLAIVIDDLGEDMAAVQTLAALPYPVTFAIWPRSVHARKAAETGHAAGYDILIHQPTEPMRYPEISPGPGALFASHTDAEIAALLRDSFTRVPYAVGMNNHMGSRFTRNQRACAAMVRTLKERGFFVLDSLTHPGSVLYQEAERQRLPAFRRDVFLDASAGKQNALNQLRKAEQIALVAGSAVAIGHPHPQTLAALREWAALRDGRVSLVRLTDLLFLPDARSF